MSSQHRAKTHFANISLALAICVLSTSADLAKAGLISDVEFLSGSTAGTEVLNLDTPGQLLSGGIPIQYNAIDNVTGAKLVTDNGDSKDFTLSGTSTAGTLGSARVVLGATGASSPFASVDSGRIGAQHSFNGTVASNNPGTVNSNTFELLFSSNLTVTDATFDFSSLNTAGSTWEYSVLQFLDPNGNPFSALTNPGWTIGAASQYAAAGAGFTGIAGIGNYIAASTATVVDVGTDFTSNGTSGAGDSPNFNYALAGLAAGTQIGGLRWTTYMEDVRGVNNGDSNFTASLLDFKISGQITAVPEPSTFVVLSAIAIGILIWRRCSNAHALSQC